MEDQDKCFSVQRLRDKPVAAASTCQKTFCLMGRFTYFRFMKGRSYAKGRLRWGTGEWQIKNPFPDAAQLRES